VFDRSHSDYSQLARPEVLMGLFHPRPEYGASERNANAIDLVIPVDSDIVVGARFHMTGPLSLPARSRFYLLQTRKRGLSANATSILS
jgi:hypothetical protein